MTTQLAIIGLGQIGASIGLALEEKREDIKRTGTDIDSIVMSQAKKIGAVDMTTSSLNAAVRNADLIILALPLDQVEKVVEAVAPAIKPGTVVMDTAPVKAAIARRMVETLPDTCSYIGLTPVLNPSYIYSEMFGIKAAKADMFQDGLFCITTPPGVNAMAIKLTVDLIQELGASPLFADLQEIDGLMASVHILPQLMSIALLNTTVDQPGWKEARKIAGRAFAEVTGPAAHLDDAEALIASAKLNKENITRKLDDTIAVLREIRQEIAQEELEKLKVRFTDAKAGVGQWLLERGRSNWLAEELPKTESSPTSAELMGNLIGFGLGRKRKKDQ